MFCSLLCCGNLYFPLQNYICISLDSVLEAYFQNPSAPLQCVPPPPAPASRVYWGSAETEGGQHHIGRVILGRCVLKDRNN